MKIACIVADDFEDSELRIPYQRLRQAGFEVEIIGANAGEELSGKKGKVRVRVERSIDDAHVEDYDALFIPGGYSPDHLRLDERFVELVRGFDDAQKPIAAICHGAQILITAGRVRDRTLTAWPTVQRDLAAAGANVLDREVVVDQNLVTSRRPSDVEAFSRAFIEQLEARAPKGSEQPASPS